MIKGVLFDLDGTLINTWDLYPEAYRLTTRDYLKKEFYSGNLSFFVLQLMVTVFLPHSRALSISFPI